MGQNHVAEDFGEFTLEEERETGVNEDYHELCELQPGQVSEIEILLHDVVHGGIRICLGPSPSQCTTDKINFGNVVLQLK